MNAAVELDPPKTATLLGPGVVIPEAELLFIDMMVDTMGEYAQSIRNLMKEFEVSPEMGAWLFSNSPGPSDVIRVLRRSALRQHAKRCDSPEHLSACSATSCHAIVR